MYKLRLIPQSPTLVKIVDRVLYRTDGVTQVSVVSPIISGVDSGRLDGDELLSLFNNFFVLMRFDLKLSVAMLLTEEKCKAIF